MIPPDTTAPPTGWNYPGNEKGRDLRIDFLRGAARVVYDLYDNTGGDAFSFVKNILVLRYGPG